MSCGVDAPQLSLKNGWPPFSMKDFRGPYMSWRYYGSMIPFRLKLVPETQACSVGLKLLSARLLPISFTIPQPRESLATAFLGFHGKCTYFVRYFIDKDILIRITK